MSSIYLYYSDACVYSPYNIQDRTLCDTSHNQSLTSVTKKSIPNGKGILDQPLVIRYSKKRYGKRSSSVWLGQFYCEGTHRRPYRPCHQVPCKMEHRRYEDVRHSFLFKTSDIDLLKIFYFVF